MLTKIGKQARRVHAQTSPSVYCWGGKHRQPDHVKNVLDSWNLACHHAIVYIFIAHRIQKAFLEGSCYETMFLERVWAQLHSEKVLKTRPFKKKTKKLPTITKKQKTPKNVSKPILRVKNNKKPNKTRSTD